MTLPAGPRKPAFMQLIEAIVRPLAALDANFERYGDLYTARISGFGPLVVINHPEGIEQVMTAPPELFDSGRGNQILAPFVGDASLLLLDGKPHQRMRKLLTPPFHGERLRTYSQDICAITHQVTEHWQPGQRFSARTMTQDISLRVIMRTVFGVRGTEKSEQLRQLLNGLLSLFDRPLNSSFAFIPALQKDWGAWSPWGHLLRQRAQIDDLLYSEIQSRRQANQPGDDILSLILTARDEAGEPLTDREVRDELMTLLFAGHETTATALAWALYWLHRYPQMRDRVRQELADLGSDPDPVAITRLPYLNAVCQETLRIYPVALFTFSRILKAPWTLMGQAFDPGTLLSICIYQLHHRPELYPNSKQFRPERFLEQQFAPYEFLPFGGGNRRCLGAAFALFEMKLVLATLLTRWQLQLDGNRPVYPVRRGVTMAPVRGVTMRVVGQVKPETAADALIVCG